MKQARGKEYLSLEASHIMSYNLTLCTKQSAKKFLLGIQPTLHSNLQIDHSLSSLTVKKKFPRKQKHKACSCVNARLSFRVINGCYVAHNTNSVFLLASFISRGMRASFAYPQAMRPRAEKSFFLSKTRKVFNRSIQPQNSQTLCSYG